MNKKYVLSILFLFFLEVSAFSQTKIIQYKTDIPWKEGGIYNYRWLIGSEFLAQPVNRNMTKPYMKFGQDQILYIFDLKNRKIAKIFDQPERGWYFVAGSGTTSSFLMGYTSVLKAGSTNAALKATTSFWKFDEKARNWSCSFTKEDAGPTQFGSIASSPLVPAYYVEPKESDDHKLLLEIFEY